MEDIELIDEGTEKHLRTIIHIDIDYYYAQVEEIRDPTLCEKPFGIQQKNIIVTCNYKARDFGVKKLMLTSDALKLCPQLLLINGEDITPYKQMSIKINELLNKFANKIEKLGLDENYLDVTNVINDKIINNYNNINSNIKINNNNNDENIKFNGYIYPENYYNLINDNNYVKDLCQCGCIQRLILGSHLAKDIRCLLFNELGITSCAGIAHNKLLAKLIGSVNKPNKQTVLIPQYGNIFLKKLINLRNITGIGQKTESLLNEININTIEDLQKAPNKILEKKFDYDTANKLKKWSLGHDNSQVKPSGKPKTIGLEDSCKTISLKKDVEDKFNLLLLRLLNQVCDDGRIPITIKIILRKYDNIKKTSHRETKQCNVLPAMFKQLKDGKIILVDGAHDKLLKIIMRLFERCVDLKKKFNITLLGLAFTKFQERKKGTCSIANFLIKKSDIEVQSITSLSNDDILTTSVVSNDQQSISSTTLPICNQQRRHYINSSPISMECEQISDASVASCSDLSESEIEPSPKKTRIGLLIAKRRCFHTSKDSMDTSSPSKLRVAELRLNSKEFDTPMLTSSPGYSQATITTTNGMTLCSMLAKATTITAPKLPPIATINNNNNNKLNNNLYPNGVDPEVFNQLPSDVQNELILSWRTPNVFLPTVQSRSNGTNLINGSVTTQTNSSQTTAPSQSSKTNKTTTLHRYFISNN